MSKPRLTNMLFTLIPVVDWRRRHVRAPLGTIIPFNLIQAVTAIVLLVIVIEATLGLPNWITMAVAVLTCAWAIKFADSATVCHFVDSRAATYNVAVDDGTVTKSPPNPRSSRRGVSINKQFAINNRLADERENTYVSCRRYRLHSVSRSCRFTSGRSAGYSWRLSDDHDG